MGEHRLGIDIGGTGIKAGLVDVGEGKLVSDRHRVPTPQPSPPDAVAEAVAGLVSEIGYRGRAGIGFPSVVVDGTVWTANNIDEAWIGVDARHVFTEATGLEVSLVNDADAAAICEARFGAAKGVRGVVLVITFGTGIGAGLLHDGDLVPNLQLGDLELEGHIPSESHFSAAAMDDEGLSWEEWAKRAGTYLEHVTVIFSPSLIVVGGGVAKKWDRWSGYLDPDLKVVRAKKGNNAGIIGAASIAL